MKNIDELRAAVGKNGEVCLPGDDGYKEAVTIWNGAIARRPSVVARCATAGAVSAAITHARADGLEISVRGGGHNYSGNALTDGGLMIDLTPMKTITVDLGAKRARCGGGTTWGELDAATQQHGLGVTGGFISKTGVGGLTLGGGIGWLSRKVGLSCDNLVGVEIVTADGKVRHASADADSEPDLFWAVRGGGGNFGVVTELDFALTEIGPMVHLGLFMVKPEDGATLFRFAREYVRTLPDDCNVFMAGLSAPPAPFVPEHLHGAPAFAIVVVGFGDAESHAKLIAPIKAALDPIVELVTPLPYVGLQSMFDASAPWGFHSYEKAVHLRELSDGAIGAILEHQAKKRFPLSFVPIFGMGGAYGRVADDATAFGGDRRIGYVINISGTTPDPADFATERTWVRDYWSALVKHADRVGSYVNFMSEQDGERVRSAYGDKYPRLQAIKKRYDPHNVFHLNANIEPA